MDPTGDWKWSSREDACARLVAVLQNEFGNGAAARLLGTLAGPGEVRAIEQLACHSGLPIQSRDELFVDTRRRRRVGLEPRFNLRREAVARLLEEIHVAWRASSPENPWETRGLLALLEAALVFEPELARVDPALVELLFRERLRFEQSRNQDLERRIADHLWGRAAARSRDEQLEVAFALSNLSDAADAFRFADLEQRLEWEAAQEDARPDALSLDDENAIDEALERREAFASLSPRGRAFLAKSWALPIDALATHVGDLQTFFARTVSAYASADHYSPEHWSRWRVLRRALDAIRDLPWAADAIEGALSRLSFAWGNRGPLVEHLVRVDRPRGLRYVAKHLGAPDVSAALADVLERPHASPADVDRHFVLAILATAHLHEDQVVVSALRRARDLDLAVETYALLDHPSTVVQAAAHGILAWNGSAESTAWQRCALGASGEVIEVIEEIVHWMAADPTAEDVPALTVAIEAAMEREAQPDCTITQRWSASPRASLHDIVDTLVVAIARSGAPNVTEYLVALSMLGTTRVQVRISTPALRCLSTIAHGEPMPRATRIWGTGELRARRALAG